jgi:endoglucanase
MVIPLDWQVGFPLRHTLFLRLDRPLEEGAELRIRLNDRTVVRQTLDTRTLRSPAIQVCQAGYDRSSAPRYALLSTWMGDGGGWVYEEPLRFQLLREEDGEVVFEGLSELAKSAEEPDDDFAGIRPDRAVNLALADTHRLDFSGFSEPGRYRVHVEGVGVSYPFEISDAVWEKAWITSMRGFWYQRASEPLYWPEARIFRPRNFHPDIGKTALRSKARMNMYTVEEWRNADSPVIRNQDEAFKKLPAYATEEVETRIAGGYFDAGDWDRRTDHLVVTLRMLNLYELDPERFQAMAWGLPGKEGLPDLLKEAVWGATLWRTLQAESGGIPGWIESSGHPRKGEVSWTDSVPLFISRPDAVSSYRYAATAWMLSEALKPFDAEEAEAWADSAERAMAFAEAEWAAIPQEHRKMHELEDSRNLAALEAWLATGDAAWHGVFQETAELDGAQPVKRWYAAKDGGERDQLLAAFRYASQQRREGDAALREQAREAVISFADTAERHARQSPFGFAKWDPTRNMGWGTLGAPQAIHLMMAWWLSGEERFREAAVRANYLPLGMNADQLSFTTGLGSDWPRNPLIIDARRGNDVPPGITLYGTWNPAFWSAWGIDRARKDGAFHPAYSSWPTSEGFVDIGYGNAGQCEYTVQHTMSYANTVWGFLMLER